MFVEDNHKLTQKQLAYGRKIIVSAVFGCALIASLLSWLAYEIITVLLREYVSFDIENISVLEICLVVIVSLLYIGILINRQAGPGFDFKPLGRPFGGIVDIPILLMFFLNISLSLAVK